MAIEHVNIADPDIHEPKGIATASSGSVYLSDGTGGGSWSPSAAGTLSSATAGQIIVADGAGDSTSQTSVRMGWQDFNDAATASTPITLSAANTFFNMTNDGAGSFTNLTYKIPGQPNIWNTSTNRFDWTGLSLGDTVIIRWDLQFTTNGTNHEISVRLRLAEGHANQYELPMLRRNYKTAGTYRELVTFFVYMGDSPTLDNPGVIQVASDTGTSNTVKVNGWAVQSTIRSDY